MSEKHESAVLFNTQMDISMVGSIVKSLEDSGFASVRVMTDMPGLVKTGDGDTLEFHLPADLANVDFVLFDEVINGRSVFELHTIFKASVESADMAFGVLLDSPSDNTIFAAWAAGFDLCLSKHNLKMDELTRFASQIRKQLQQT